MKYSHRNQFSDVNTRGCRRMLLARQGSNIFLFRSFSSQSLPLEAVEACLESELLALLGSWTLPSQCLVSGEAAALFFPSSQLIISQSAKPFQPKAVEMRSTPLCPQVSSSHWSPLAKIPPPFSHLPSALRWPIDQPPIEFVMGRRAWLARPLFLHARRAN